VRLSAACAERRGQTDWLNKFGIDVEIRWLFLYLAGASLSELMPALGLNELIEQ
jgi:hypothetical protein